MYEFAGRFNREDLFLKEFTYWILILRPVPTTLGSCIILLKRNCPSLAEVTPEEMAEFPKVCSLFEEKNKALYGAVKFNYHANMMKENFVHFHAIPRYDKDIERYGIKWIDKEWPTGVEMYKTEVAEEVLYEIKNDFLKEDSEIDETTIPESVLEYGFDFDWDEKDVWKLDYPAEEIDLEMLEWHFDIPFWSCK